MIKKFNHPALFYILSTFIPWFFWCVAGYVSHITPSREAQQNIAMILALIGLFSPLIVAFWLIGKDSALQKDLFSRLFNFKQFSPLYLYLSFLLMPGSILAAQAISLVFGYERSQFSITGHFTFSSGLFPVWFLLIFAPVVEELAWHTYGTDCLRSKFSLFTASILFGVFWAIWHIPLSLIKDYYHSNVVLAGWIYGVNFLVSVIPFVLIMNWLYYKSHRNVVVTILFHITACYFNEIFATHPDSKIIQTVLLSLFACVLVFKEKEFFFKKEYQYS
jgi:uncharacterized protein